MKYLIVLVSVALFISCQTGIEKPDVPDSEIYSNQVVNDFKFATTKSGETVVEFKVDNKPESYIILGTGDSDILNREIEKAEFVKFQNGLMFTLKDEVWLYFVDKRLSVIDEENLEELTLNVNGKVHFKSVVGFINIKEPFPIDFEFNKKFNSVREALHKNRITSKVNVDCNNCLYGGPGASACTAPTITGGSGGVTCQAGYYACCSMWDSDCCWVGTGGGSTGGGPTGGGPTGGGSTGGGSTGGGSTGGGSTVTCVLVQVQIDEESGNITLIFQCI